MERKLILVALLFASLCFGQTSQKVDYINNPYSGNMKFYKADTSAVMYFGTNDSILVTSVIDSAYSWTYKNDGRFNLQVNTGLSGTAGTISYGVIVQTANSGPYFSTPYSMPDSLFKDKYWLCATASQVDIVSMSEDSITARGVLEPIQIPMLDDEWMRIKIVRNVTHTDSSDVEIAIYKRK